MPASRVNYLVVYDGDSQVYGCGSKEIALSSPPPDGFELDDKRILFVSCEPENRRLTVRQLPQEEVLSAEIVEKKKKKNAEDK